MADGAPLGERLRLALRTVEGFPAPRVRFIDIGPVLNDPDLFARVIAALAAPFSDAGVTHVIGLEARGLYFAGAVAVRLGAGFVPVRKPGKLPPPTVRSKGVIGDTRQVAGLAELEAGRSNTYQKTYEFEMAQNALVNHARVLVVDDLLAKGGSVDAVRRLLDHTSAVLVGAAFVIELEGLGGRANLDGLPIHSLIRC